MTLILSMSSSVRGSAFSPLLLQSETTMIMAMIIIPYGVKRMMMMIIMMMTSTHQ
jgi:hypothetical protein